MLGFLKTRTVLDEDSAFWLFDTFAWSFRNFHARDFYRETSLILPSNKFFPGRESSAQSMAELIFEQVKDYAGLKRWPCRVVNANTGAVAPSKAIEGQLQGSQSVAASIADAHGQLVIPYHPSQLAKPESLIASYATTLAHYLAQSATEAPPGGMQFLPQATELIAVFMGFGIMVANSAYTFKGGCGSCYNPLAERSAYLSQDEATYALAIFCSLKSIPNKDVLPHLKNYLRPVFKNAIREIRGKRLEELAQIQSPSRNIDVKRI